MTPTAGDALAQLIAELDLERIELLIRSLTRWFQLINLAEDNERVRRIRAREAREWPAPRRGSIDEAVSQMAQARDRPGGSARSCSRRRRSGW